MSVTRQFKIIFLAGSAIFSPKGGDYSRGPINRGMAIIRGNTVDVAN